MALSKLQLNPNVTSNKIPEWIDLNANKSTSIVFLIFPEHHLGAFNAVKNSTLPREVIDYLTEEGIFEGVLSKAGFEIENTPGVDNATLKIFTFKEVLGKYNEDFLNIIAPYVLPYSYIEIEDKNGFRYRWGFNGSTCKKVYLK